MTLRNFFFTLGLLSSSCLSPPLSAQNSDDRLKEIEARLNKALEMIEKLSSEVATLKHEASKLQEVDVSGVRVSEAEARLDDLENLVLETEDRFPSGSLISAFDSEVLTIGGFLLSTLTHADGEDGSATSFNRNVFEILLGGKLNDTFSYFFAQAFTREASPTFIDQDSRGLPDFNLTTGAPTPIAWGNYRFSDAFNVRFGRWVAPHGIINIEHFPAILLDTEQPQFLRPFGGQTIFANFQTGIQIHGQTYAGFGGRGKLDYAVYVGNFGGNQDEFNVGGRVGYSFGDSGFALGINTAFGKRVEELESDYQLIGVDLLYDKGPILWKTEFFATEEDLGGNRLAFYSQPAYRFSDQWTAFYRYDFLDNGDQAGDTQEHVLGLAFNPIPTIRIRGTTTFRDFEPGPLGLRNTSAQLYQLSTTLSF